MKRRVVKEWTCDRCGRIIEGRIFRPLGMGKSRVHIDIGLYYYKDKRDLCSYCANDLAEVIDNYLKRGNKNDTA